MVVMKNCDPLLCYVSDVRLRTVRNERVGARVGHGEEEGLGVLQLEVLVGELVTVDGFAARALIVSAMTPLLVPSAVLNGLHCRG
jgi:hypothetical protein